MSELKDPCPVCGEGEYDKLIAEYRGPDEPTRTYKLDSHTAVMTQTTKLDPLNDDGWVYTVWCSAREEPHGADEITEELRATLKAEFMDVFPRFQADGTIADADDEQEVKNE